MALPTNLFQRDDPTLITWPTEPPYATPSLTANLVCRIGLGIIANLVCLVPMRLLWQNGELAAVVFIINLEVKNLETILNAVIWRDNDTASWWPGYGLCDFMPYLHNVTLSLFLTCLLAIMRNLAQQVGLLRANPLTVREKRRRNLLQALIMFPLPIIQLAFTWPLTSQRFVVGPLVGCSWVAYPAWPYIAFFVLAPAVVALLTAGYAALIFIRFREVAKTTSSALSHNRVAHHRAQRTRRRLYLMVLSILLPFLPIVVTLAVINFKDAYPFRPFDYNEIHHHVLPYRWNTIMLLPSQSFGFAYMNSAYISILSAVPVFLFFGMTKDAMNNYRQVFVSVGLGKIFPSLYQEYDPDRSAYGNATEVSNITNSNSTSNSTIGKIKSVITMRQLSTTSTVSGEGSHASNDQPIDRTLRDAEEGRHISHQRPQPSYQPCGDDSTPIPLPHRNPFLFRTNLAFPIPFTLPFFKSKKSKNSGDTTTVPLEPFSSAPDWEDTNPSRIQTRVWSADDEVRLCNNSSPQQDTGSIECVPAVLVETRLTRQSTRRWDRDDGLRL